MTPFRSGSVTNGPVFLDEIVARHGLAHAVAVATEIRSDVADVSRGMVSGGECPAGCSGACPELTSAAEQHVRESPLLSARCEWTSSELHSLGWSSHPHDRTGPDSPRPFLPCGRTPEGGVAGECGGKVRNGPGWSAKCSACAVAEIGSGRSVARRRCSTWRVSGEYRCRSRTG